MQKITTAGELKAAILLLEKEQANKAILLKKEFNIAFDSLKPVNLIKNTFNELTASPEFKGNFINTTLGLAAGYLSKKVIIGNTINPLKGIAGTILQLVVSKIVTKNSNTIKSTGMNFFNKIFKKKNREPQDINSL